MEKRKVQTKEEIAIVNRTLTVKIPKEFDEYLQSLAKALGRSVETFLTENLFSVLRGFFSCGHAQGWLEEIVDIDNPRTKELEAQIRQVADKMFDC